MSLIRGVFMLNKLIFTAKEVRDNEALAAKKQGGETIAG